VLLAPWGQVESTNGSFVVDDEAVALAIEAFAKHGTDLPIDYEHQTLGGTYSSPTGQAPAAGWVKGLLAEPGVGLVAQIEWTEQAEKMLAAKEYRYLSPVAIIRKRDRKLVAVHSAALTNKPAIVGMQPIVNRVGAESGDHSDEPLASLRVELDLPIDTGPEEMLVAAGRRLADLRQQARQRHIERRIAEAVRAGKLVEAQRAWAEALVAREEGLFDEWFRTAPVVIQTGASVSPQQSDGHRRHSTAARARAEFSSNPTLGCLTTEEAYVADALRRAG
jgi:phage I-like protein